MEYGTTRPGQAAASLSFTFGCINLLPFPLYSTVLFTTTTQCVMDLYKGCVIRTRFLIEREREKETRVSSGKRIKEMIITADHHAINVVNKQQAT